MDPSGGTQAVLARAGHEPALRVRSLIPRSIASVLIAVSFVPAYISTSWCQCEPDDVVAAYCRLDSAGTRLGSVDPKPCFDLVLWEEEPGWDQTMIIDGYDLVQSHVKGDTAVVTVMYRQAGWLTGGELQPAPAKKLGTAEHAEVVNFKLVEQDSCWKIASPVIIPHESVDHAIARIGRWLAKPPDWVASGMNDSTEAHYQSEMRKYFEIMRASHEALVKYRDSNKK